MKTIQRVFRWLFRSETKKQKRPVSEKTNGKAADKPIALESAPFTDDDSPPGYKIRWHH